LRVLFLNQAKEAFKLEKEKAVLAKKKTGRRR
jgi:hypothetical protein